MKIGIIGAGSWGCALATAFASIADVTIWSKHNSQVIEINQKRTNHGYLPDGVYFYENVIATNELVDLRDSDLLIIATPLNSLREVLAQIKALLVHTNDLAQRLSDIITVCKGFEVGTGMLPHQIVVEVLSDMKVSYGALLGPSFALDVVYKRPTALTMVSDDLDFVFRWINVFKGIKNFRIYAGSDIIGSEIGAGVKNIVAIAAGIIDGLNLGLNARAALITRSLSEISKLIVALGGKSNTVYGLTGIGDLILTCTGDLSRNRNVGLELAKGESLNEILHKLGHVAEGVSSTNEVYKLSCKLKLEMPIVEAVYKVINQKIDLESCIYDLINREPKLEFV